jgi:calcineurin-like phosphoesterase family protein
MNQQLIHNWNSTVEPDDTVFHLGDFGFGNMSEFQGRLNGHIHLIEGNHDSSTTWNTFDFASRQRHLVLNIAGCRLLLIHMPIHDRAYASAKPAGVDYDVCLYGHVHNNQQGWIQHQTQWHKNCGVEVQDYRPQLLSDVLADCPHPQAADFSVHTV